MNITKKCDHINSLPIAANFIDIWVGNMFF